MHFSPSSVEFADVMVLFASVVAVIGLAMAIVYAVRRKAGITGSSVRPVLSLTDGAAVIVGAAVVVVAARVAIAATKDGLRRDFPCSGYEAALGPLWILFFTTFIGGAAGLVDSVVQLIRYRSPILAIYTASTAFALAAGCYVVAAGTQLSFDQACD